MVSVLQADLREELRALNAVLQFRHERKRISVGDGDSVDAAVVDTQPKSAALRFRTKRIGDPALEVDRRICWR